MKRCVPLKFHLASGFLKCDYCRVKERQATALIDLSIDDSRNLQHVKAFTFVPIYKCVCVSAERGNLNSEHYVFL